MTRLLLRNIHTLVTMVAGELPLHAVDVLIEDGKIAALGALGTPDPQPDRVIDGSHCVAYPGFINTHHHLYQTLTRNIPKVQNAKLFDWLVGLYEVWRELGPEAVEVVNPDEWVHYPRVAPRDILVVHPVYLACLLEVTHHRLAQVGFLPHPRGLEVVHQVHPEADHFELDIHLL